MPNAFASAMLWGWPIVTIVLFRFLPVPKAAAAGLIAGYLLLPTQPSFNFPLLPAYNRELAAALPVLVMALIMSRPAPGPRAATAPAPNVIAGWLPRTPLLALFVLMLVASPFFTAATNSGGVQIGGAVRPGLSLYDGASGVLGAAMTLIPFLVARKWLAHPREHEMLLGLLCLAGLAYSLPALYEVRMSPQLNNMIYGFFPHSWIQHIRGGGFRPLVFLEHGLRLGIFMAVAVLATLGYLRARSAGKRGPLWLAALWLFGTLVLCKTAGALILASLFAPVILFLGSRMQMLVAAMFAALVLFYPMTRSTGLFPVETVRSTLTSIVGPGRMASLDFRFRNEEVLLERANDKPLFGWGGWGRNMLYDERGRSTTIGDGTWVLIFGKDGWFGYIAIFGLLTVPVILLAVRRRGDDMTMASSTLAVVLVVNLIDLIPNSGLTPITWMMAGAIAGRLELGKIAREDLSEAKGIPEQASPYRRTFPSKHDGAMPATLRRPASPARGYRQSGSRGT